MLVGPSGCGKSTTLRMIAGLEDVSSGEIRIGGRRVNDVPPKDRDIAMVFQNYALYPHMSVRRNMAFGLELRYGTGWLRRAWWSVVDRQRSAELASRRGQISAEVGRVARVLGIEHLLDRVPGQLSGGERQRVALGRAIVRQPAAFLFDEPLSNLDAQLRVEMRRELKELHRRLNDDNGLRDPRSGGSPDAGRPHRGARSGRGAADRHAAGVVRPAAKSFRGRFYRHPADEFHRRGDRRGRRVAALAGRLPFAARRGAGGPAAAGRFERVRVRSAGRRHPSESRERPVAEADRRGSGRAKWQSSAKSKWSNRSVTPRSSPCDAIQPASRPVKQNERLMVQLGRGLLELK